MFFCFFLAVMDSIPMSTTDQCLKRTYELVEEEKSILKKVQRRWNVTYPSKISCLIKSALLQNIETKEKGEIFRELSDFTEKQIYTILGRGGEMFEIQDSQGKIHEIIFGTWPHGDQRIWYDGQYYDEFSRSGNLYKHVGKLRENDDMYGYMDVEDGYVTAQEYKEGRIVKGMHDRWEKKHTDIESILKTDDIRYHEDRIFAQEIENTWWPILSPYICSMHRYSKKWRFKWDENIDVLVWDIPQYYIDYNDPNYNYSEWVGVLYEASIGGLSHVLASDAVVEFRNKVVPVLQVRSLREQIKDNYRDLLLIPQFLKDHRADVEKWERHERVHQTKNIKFDQWLDIIQRSLEKLDNEMNR